MARDPPGLRAVRMKEGEEAGTGICDGQPEANETGTLYRAHWEGSDAEALPLHRRGHREDAARCGQDWSPIDNTRGRRL